jgi:hypothetical protein
MRTLLLVAIATFGLAANAHFKIGTYAGETATGEICKYEFIAVDFGGMSKHPLNENVAVEVTLGSESHQFNNSHRPMFKAGKIGPEKEILSGALYELGAMKGNRVYMNNKGPFKFEFYKKDNNGYTMIECNNLTYETK